MRQHREVRDVGDTKELVDHEHELKERVQPGVSLLEDSFRHRVEVLVEE